MPKTKTKAKNKLKAKNQNHTVKTLKRNAQN